jgi:hypothetical protein
MSVTMLFSQEGICVAWPFCIVLTSGRLCDYCYCVGAHMSCDVASKACCCVTVTL